MAIPDSILPAEYWMGVIEPAAREGLSWQTVLAGLVTFFGVSGLMAGIGFLVHQASFALLGLPYPPFATTDYLRVAGLFLFDLVVLILLLYGVTWLVLPALALTALFALIIWVWSKISKGSGVRQQYRMTWQWLGEKYQQRFHGPGALAACLLALIVFIFYYHYPVFAQRDITTAFETCGNPDYAPLSFSPFPQLWAAVDCRRAEVRAMILDRERIREAQVMYRNAALCLAVLAVYTLFHPFNQLRASGRDESPGRRWLWSVTAALLLLSLTFLPTGYAILFRIKEAPLVTIVFKGDEKAKDLDWQKQITGRSWFLVFQGEKEVWIYWPPSALILQKEQLGAVTIGDRHWIFPSK